MIVARLAALAIALALVPPAAAMHFFAEPPVLHLMGRVHPEDWAAWEEAMARYKGKIDTVVFHQSPGGHSNTGRKIGQDIRTRGLHTVVAGRCRSACANMFLGGKERHFSSRLEDATALGYHGSYNRTTKELNRKRTGDYFVEMTGGKMSEELIERFIRIENYKGFLFMIHPKQRPDARAPLAYLCTGEENTRKFASECEAVNGVDALASGVVTSWEVVPTPKAPRTLSKAPTTKNW